MFLNHYFLNPNYADFKYAKKKMGCPEVVFEIFMVKHQHVNNFLSKNKWKPFFYEKIHNFFDN